MDPEEEAAHSHAVLSAATVTELLAVEEILLRLGLRPAPLSRARAGDPTGHVALR